MARKFGKRGKAGTGEPAADPRDLFGAPQLPRNSARPASSTPLADQLNRGWPGVDPGYVVLPRSLAEGMSLPWQQQMAALLAQFHTEHGRLAWPIYRVVPSRYEKLVDLDEEQLAEAGYLVEMDTEGEMVYRERSGRKVDDPANTSVLVACLDPIPKPAQRPAPPPPPVQPGATPPPARPRPPARAPAPMNIGPAPVWHTVKPPAGPPAGPPSSAPASGRSQGFPEITSPPGHVLSPPPSGPGSPVEPGAVAAHGVPGQVPPAAPGGPPVGADAPSGPPPSSPAGGAAGWIVSSVTQPGAVAPAPPAPPAETSPPVEFSRPAPPPEHVGFTSPPEPTTPVGFTPPVPPAERPLSAEATSSTVAQPASAGETATPVGFTAPAEAASPPASGGAREPEQAPPAPITEALGSPTPPASEGAVSRALDQTSQRPAEPQPPVNRTPPPSGFAPPPPSGWSSGPPSRHAAPPAVDPHVDTPPRGTPIPSADRGWFDDLEGERPPESSKLDPEVDGGEFGPTGDPTEIPYRYRQ